MSAAKDGDTVAVRFTGKLEDGTVFEATGEDEPLKFTLGLGETIPGFEAALFGMEQGESKTVTLEPESAFGPRFEQMVHQVERAAIPDEIELKVGIVLQAQQPGGEALSLTVIDLNEESVTLDANHPLAGKRIVYDIELVEIA
jgi:peptidylprolyl isomerase